MGATPPASLPFRLRLASGQVLEVVKPWRTTFIVGRRSHAGPQLNDIFLDDPYADCQHCRIFLGQDGQWMVEDLGSNHGTRLHDTLVTHPHPLRTGDEIRVGTTHIAMPAVEEEEEVTFQASRPPPVEEDEAKTFSPVPPPVPLPTLLLPAATDPVALLRSFPLFQIFLDRNYLEPASIHHLVEQARQQGTTFFRTLITSNMVRFVDEICQLTAEHLGLEIIAHENDLAGLAMATPWLSFSRAETLGMILITPLASNRHRYATLDPFDLPGHDWITHCGGKPADRVLVFPDVFFATLRRLKNRVTDDTKEVGISIDITLMDEKRVREQVGQVDIPLIVNYLLHRAHLQNASDIHIEPTEELLLIRMRVDGILQEEHSLPSAFHAELVSRLKIMARLDVAEKRRPQDGHFGVMIRNHAIDIRVSSYPTVFGEKFVLRLLDRDSLRPTIESLKMNDRDLVTLRDKLGAPLGLIVISGPTGAGKTTTLYSCLSAINKSRNNVMTVEDPVEYRLRGVHQMQVNSKIGLTFATGLRTILRQDPDIIMVGEIRDRETAGMVVQAALTGHLVLSTIHANSAVSVVTRLLELGVEPYLLANTLTLTVSQRLIRVLCQNCRVPVSGETVLREMRVQEGVTDERLQAMGLHIDPHMDYIQSTGCPSCRNTGYRGRRPIFELFEVNDAARGILLDPGGLNSRALKDLAQASGMTTLISHGEHLVMEEVTTFSELVRVIGEKE